ncbi:MAG: hypothetical protein HeimC3_21250 [Candidatus Heimdallarchaeota archaeon LC_3]|nr:MAG: hypothetical protein HeimC3_21250 [Candidatus Heimdallarchaeota archaeon LC_3]
MATVRYLVTNVEDSVNYYVKNLGFELKENFGQFAIVEHDDLTLWLSGPKTSGAKAILDNGDKPIPGGWNRIVIKVDSIDNTVKQLKSLGTDFRNEVLSGVGGKQVLIRDPSGNPIEINEPSKFAKS